MRTDRDRQTGSLQGWALALLLALPFVAGCGLWPGAQAQLSGTVLGDSATAREAGHIVPATLSGATVTCDGATTSTTADGAFQLDLSPASAYTCTVSAPGYTRLTARLTGAAGSAVNVAFSALSGATCAANGHAAFTCPELRLAPGTLSGIVTDPQTDSAASNIPVECWDLNTSTWSDGQPAPGATANTDQYGRYVLSLPVDPYACATNNAGQLYRVAVAPATATSADMQLCDPQCPSFSYHSGQVMHSFTAYVIFWLPPGTSFEPPGQSNTHFESLVQRYFRDVGDTSFFAILTQYWDRDGPISGAATLGGAYVDTTPYLHAGTSADPLYDSDVETAVNRSIQVNGWKDDQTHEFFVLTGYGIDECESPSRGTSCTYTGGSAGFCGYHGSLGGHDTDATYAYIADNAACATVPSFPQYPSPNGDQVADGTISTISHEQFEAITDPIEDGWYDGNYYTGEAGDKCETDYGTIHANGSNVTLSGHPYILQAEWSNAAASCAFAYTP
ncbi:MAG: carboxypeptidase regulatory-like domain-containing protein [Ktedonobacterales bacterium]